MKRIGLAAILLAVFAGQALGGNNSANNLDPKVLNLLQSIIGQVQEGKISKEQLQAFVEHRNPFEKRKSQANINGDPRIFVDYTRPFSDMISDGRFDWTNSDITAKNFSITNRPNGEVEMKLFHFNRIITPDQAIQEMDKEGYRPAELPELLAYAKANPDEQRKYPIVGLGSVWRNFSGDRYVPCLYGVGDGRGLGLGWYCGVWHSGCRFLAVRK